MSSVQSTSHDGAWLAPRTIAQDISGQAIQMSSTHYYPIGTVFQNERTDSIAKVVAHSPLGAGFVELELMNGLGIHMWKAGDLLHVLGHIASYGKQVEMREESPAIEAGRAVLEKVRALTGD